MTDMELAEEIAKLIANKRDHVKMMSGGNVTCIHVHLLEQIIATLRREPEPLQDRVATWMQACFGPEISSDKTERNHRFVEESLELAQANGCTISEAHQLVDYVFSRPIGDAHQECGGVLITLAALCLASGLDMGKAGEDELARIWKKIDVIRRKQAAKPQHSPLPERPLSGEMVMLSDLIKVLEDVHDSHKRKGLPLTDSQFAKLNKARSMLSAAEAEGRKG